MTSVAPLLPDVTHPMYRGHWEAAAQGRLAIVYCARCGTPQWPPRPNCGACHSFDLEWRDVDQRGTLFSYFVAHKALHPSLEHEVPYATAAVTLPAGVRMLGRLVGVDYAHIEIGMALTPCFVQRAPGVTLVFWEPSST